MSVQAAFLLPSSPLPFFRPDNAPWQPLHSALQTCGRRVAELAPDVLIVYSTSWTAVMDQLWQTRAVLEGRHIDHNWFEYGELGYRFRTDTELAARCVAGANAAGLQSKGVDYDQFPIDTGTIVAMHYLNPEGRIPVVITSNNLYHDGATTRRIAATAVNAAAEQGKRAVVVAIGELSGTFFRHDIDIAADTVFTPAADAANHAMLDLLVGGDGEAVRAALPAYAGEAKVDFGFKHLEFLLEALGDRIGSAEVLGYGPLYGRGGAVVQLNP